MRLRKPPKGYFDHGHGIKSFWRRPVVLVAACLCLLAWVLLGGTAVVKQHWQRVLATAGSAEAAHVRRLIEQLHTELARQDDEITSLLQAAEDSEQTRNIKAQESEIAAKEEIISRLSDEIHALKNGNYPVTSLGGGGFFATSTMSVRDKSRIIVFPRNDVYMANELSSGRGWEVDSVAYLMNLVKPNDVVVDVGMGCGTLAAFLASKVGPSGRVIGFEPQQIMYQAAIATMVLNDLRNVHLEQAAVAHKDGTTQMYGRVPDASEGAYRKGMQEAVKDGSLINYAGMYIGTNGEEVPMWSLDSYLADVKGRISVIKVDVEGAEALVIWGARKTIRQHLPFIHLKSDYTLRNDTVEGVGGVSQKVLSFRHTDFLISLGYTELPPGHVSERNAGFKPPEDKRLLLKASLDAAKNKVKRVAAIKQGSGKQRAAKQAGGKAGAAGKRKKAKQTVADEASDNI